ncbi:amidase family protein [soil metagenome]
MPELHQLNATELLELYRSRQVSPVEVTQALIDRIDAVNPAVNSVCIRNDDDAMSRAKLAEQRYMGRTSTPPRPLEGVPVAIKDEVDVAGQINTMGSLIFKDNIAETTAPIADKILQSGAIPHVRTTTPEFSCAPFTHSRMWGITRNPWNLAFDVGGSSGGAGASLAAEMTPLASGSDIGGSIRMPASVNGVVGFKAPFGRVAGYSPYNLDQYCHDGAMARSVADVALMHNVIAGPHPADIVSMRPQLRIPSHLHGVQGWRIALTTDLGGYVIDPEVVANLRRAGAALERAGAIVEEVELGWDVELIRDSAQKHFGTIMGAEIGRIADEHGELMTDYALHFAAWAREAGTDGFAQGLAQEGALYLHLSKIFQSYRILLAPGFPLPALEAGNSYVDKGPVIAGIQQANALDFLTTVPFNIMSRCPVLSVPSGLASNGVPTGVQIVGRTYDDVSVFRAGAVLEKEIKLFSSAETRPTFRAE